jgi:hypothetical protein
MSLPPPDPRTLARPSLRISTSSGRVKVIAEARPDVVVDRGGLATTLPDGVVEVRPTRPSGALEVRCPVGTDVVVGTASAGVELLGQFGSVRVTTASGSIKTGSVSQADLRSASGKVGVDECAGRCRASTKSGTVTVSVAGEAEVSSVSGTVTIEAVDGTVEVRTVSGKVSIGTKGGGPVEAQTMSGAISIRIPKGMRPAIRMAGRRPVHTDCEQGDDITIDVSTISGAVEIVPS